MQVFSMFKWIFQKIGIMNKEYKIIFLGLDNAGKTTLLRKLKDNTIRQVSPTQYAHQEQVKVGNKIFDAIDLGGLFFLKKGHESMRKIWKNYISNIDGIIYLIDSSDQERFQISNEELQNIINMQQLKNIPILLLGNKMDKKGAINECSLKIAFNLAKKTYQGYQEINQINNKPINLVMCSLYTGEGYLDGINWMNQYLQ